MLKLDKILNMNSYNPHSVIQLLLVNASFKTESAWYGVIWNLLACNKYVIFSHTYC